MDQSLVTILWLTSFALIVVRYYLGRPTVGLLMCFWAQLALNHLFGHLFYALSEVNAGYIARSESGYEVSGYAMLGLTAGIVAHDLLVRLWPSTSIRAKSSERIGPKALDTMNRLGGFSVGVGAAFYLLGMTGFYAVLPSSTSVFSASAVLLLAGLCLKWWALRRLGRPGAAWLWATIGLIYPLVTTLVGGFLGFGVFGVLALACFFAPAVRGRWLWVTVAPVAAYLGLSVWVTYAAFRGELREQVWGDRSFAARVDVLYDGMVNSWKWVDVNDPGQLVAMERLNQNILIGESVQHLEAGQGRFAAGETFEQAVVALVPRILWPSKPVFAGGNGMVSRYTGRQFAEGTSVGMGPVMELYVNFGRPAVFAGFLLLGLGVTALDRRAWLGLDGGSGGRFLLLFCLGHVSINALNSFAETLPSMIGACVLVGLTLTLFTRSRRLLAGPVGASS